MITNCHDLVNAYIEWLRQKISIENINGVCEITTPFLDRHNDQIQIYVKKTDNDLVLTDDSYTMTDLRLSGCEINTESRKQFLNSILNGFGVQLIEDELIVKAKPEDFPQKKHNLIQAMLSINDLFVVASSHVKSFFKEDVERFLYLNEIRFTQTLSFTGKSKLVHYFDFVIPASKEKPERIIKIVNKPNRQNITSLIFSCTDIKEVREVNSTYYGVLNDTEQTVNPDHISALKQYGLTPFFWSRRDDYTSELAA